MVLIKSNPKVEAKIDPSEVEVVEDKSNGAGAAEETEKEEAILSLSEAAKKIDPSHLAACLDELKGVPELDLWRLNIYLEEAFSQVSSLQWLNMIKESPLSDVPLSDIPKPVYETAVDWISKLPSDEHWKFVTWALDLILIDWAAHAIGEQRPSTTLEVAIFVELPMVLRGNPDSLTSILPMLRGRRMYQGQDKLPLIVWMMAQAFQDDLPAGLYAWAHNLLPLLGGNNNYSPESVDLILQFVEKRILSSNPEARTILVNGAAKGGEGLIIPPCSFEMLVRLTFPASSARVEGTTERFEAIYPVLKEVALAPRRNALKQIFTFSLKLAAAQGNTALAKEAIEIAIIVLTANVDCFKQWDILYKENLEASVALLKKLVDEWKDHSLKLSSSSSDTLTVKQAMNNFRIKNEKAITEGVDNRSLYIKADKSCKLISTRLLSRGGYLGIAPSTAMVIAAAAVGTAVTLSVLPVA